MSRLDHDRNVLFGVLAWQTGLVDRGRLLDAMYDCATSACADLPDALTKRGLITDADRHWLEEIMRRQVQNHSDDPKRTLAGLDAVDSLHHELDRAGVSPNQSTLAAAEQVDVRAGTRIDAKTIEHSSEFEFDVGSDVREAAGETRSGANAQAGLGRDVRFRVLRTHARGGLGEVFVAVDNELKRDVALKQILPKQAGNQTSRARFMLEAEITGNLEHPGVVPVYALGSRDDGCPYYAMRFIRGESLEDAIQAYHGGAHWDDGGEKALELRDLLSRFIAVCNTMEYAHSRGIIHRDIKPENIMLGRYGETLVVDWGLARPYRNIDSALDTADDIGGVGDEPRVSQTTERPTQMGSVVGTPQFMAPEQAAGRLDLMGPKSDVYSLGATLYCLLTDQAAFNSPDVRSVLQDVQQGLFPTPRQIKRDVPPALEAICLKAMRLKPDDRYESARALAADVQRWLADEPVSAYAETSLERMLRWMRRHKTWTQAGAAAVVLIACVAGVAYMREAALRSDLQTALAHEAAARSDADTARASAEAHARRAEAQGALALGTLKTVLFDIQVRLKNLPATHGVRRNMLDTVVAGLQQVTRSLETAPEADQSLVRARLDIGDIYLNTGVSEGSGATELAEEQYRRAMETAEKLRNDPARRTAAEIDLAAAYQRLGDVGMQRGQWSAGVEWLKKALELREQIASRRSDDLQAKFDLAASVQRLGLVHQLQGEWGEADEFFQRFLELSSELQKADPKNVEYLRNLSVAQERVGDLALRSGEEADAEAAFRESLQLRRTLIERDPTNPAAQRDLSVTLDRLAELAQGRGELDSAEKLMAESLEIRKDLYEGDPDNMQCLRDLSVSYIQLGDAALARNRNSQAAEYFEFYLEMVQRLTQVDSTNVQYRRDLAAAHSRIAQVKVRLGDIRAAAAAARSRAEILAKISADEPTDVDVLRELSNSLRDRGEIEQQLGDLAAAKQAFEGYLKLARGRLADRPQDDVLRRVEIDACFRSGALAMTLGDFTAAESSLNEAARKGLAVAEAAPNDSAAWINLANYEEALLQCAWEARNAKVVRSRAQALVARLQALRKRSDSPKQAFDQWIMQVETMLDEARRAAEVAESATSADKLKLPSEAALLDFRAAALERSGDWGAARAAAERMVGEGVEFGPAVLIAARRLARLAVAEPGDRREADARRCLELLVRCREMGLFRSLEGATRLENGAEFRELLQREDFRKLLEAVRTESRPAEAVRTGDTVT